MALARARKKKEEEDKKKELNNVNVVIIKPGNATDFPKKGDSIAM
jgi:hypothetical protein